MAKSEEQIYWDWEPRGVACSRGGMRSGMTYDAEIKFLDKQYLVKTGFSNRADAMAASQVIVDDLKARIKKEGLAVLGNLKEAKP